jgi:hypothetical protein
MGAHFMIKVIGSASTISKSNSAIMLLHYILKMQCIHAMGAHFMIIATGCAGTISQNNSVIV